MKKVFLAIFVLSLTFVLVGFTSAATRYAEITSPAEGSDVYGLVDFDATLYNDDVDNGVQWAVRQGTCAAGTNTVLGNVDGHNDAYDWDGYNFHAETIVSTWDPGMYCFIFNPRESAGEANIRETREFYVAPKVAAINGGGHMLEELGTKRKNWLDVSFGGWVEKWGDDTLVGNFQVNLHNVGGDGLDKSKFHGTEIVNLNLFDGNSATCHSAVNFRVNGTFNGEEGYSMIFRAGDFGSPNTIDTVRITIYNGGSIVYDTSSPTEFHDDSSCVGNSRTYLDTGNITIWQE